VGSDVAEKLTHKSKGDTLPKKAKFENEYASSNEIENILKRKKSSGNSMNSSRIMETALRKAEEKFSSDYERMKDVYIEECAQIRDHSSN